MSRNIEVCHIDIVLKIYGSYLKNHSTDVLHVCAQFNAFSCWIQIDLHGNENFNFKILWEKCI